MNKKIKNLFTLFALSLLVSSCNSIVHDDIEDCPEGLVIELTPRYAARNVFEGEVNDVHITLLDANDNKVRQIEVSEQELKANNYLIDVPVGAGEYKVLVWNGLCDTENYTFRDDFGVTLKRENNETSNILTPLWHGYVTDVTVKRTTQTHVIVPMIKDTNDVVVMVHDNSGDPIDAERFAYTITSADGAMALDNTLTDEDVISYHHFKNTSEVIDGSLYDEPADGQLQVGRGELNMLRLTTGRPSYLTITDTDNGDTVLNVNLNQLIIMARSSVGAVSNLSNDEYFDSEDHYDLTFFLNRRENGFTCIMIVVNGWVIRPQQLDL